MTESLVLSHLQAARLPSDKQRVSSKFAIARIAAEDFVKLFERVRPVHLFRDANPHAAGVTGGEIFQRCDLVGDHVRLFAAGPLVDHAANDHDRVGLDLLLVVDELIGPDDRPHDPLGVLQIEHGVAAGAAGLRVLRVRILDRRKHSAEHHFGAMLQFRRFHSRM